MLRIAAVAAVIVLAVFDGVSSTVFVVVAAAATAYALTLAVAARFCWRPESLARMSAGDVVASLAGVCVTGGPDSAGIEVIVLVPFAFCLMHRGRALAWTSGSLFGGFVLVCVPFVLTAQDTMDMDASSGMLAGAAGLALTWGLSTALADALARRERELEAAAGRQSFLLASALQAEDGERERIAEALHDDALQSLLAAEQDLGEAAEGDPRALHPARAALKDSIHSLRQLIGGLHPDSPLEDGMALALSAEVRRAAHRGDLTPHVRIDQAALSMLDLLLLSLARELIFNVVKHARATSLSVELAREHDCIVLTVADDGRGISSDDVREARENGHIGLLTLRARVVSAGGRCEFVTSAHMGTTVRLILPLQATSQPAAEAVPEPVGVSSRVGP